MAKIDLTHIMMAQFTRLHPLSWTLRLERHKQKDILNVSSVLYHYYRFKTFYGITNYTT